MTAKPEKSPPPTHTNAVPHLVAAMRPSRSVNVPVLDGLKTQPAELVLAVSALHPVASPSLLNKRHALGALLSVVDQPQDVLMTMKTIRQRSERVRETRLARVVVGESARG
jgi:hypothetical protein